MNEYRNFFDRNMIISKAITFRASSIGDCLMGKYFLENIHEQFPQAKCGILVAGNGKMIKDLLHGYPWLAVIEANRRRPMAIWRAGREFFGSDCTLTQYAEHQFSLTSKVFARLITRRGRMFGFDDEFQYNQVVYDKMIPYRGEVKSGPVFLLEQAALRAAGAEVAVQDVSLRFTEDDSVLKRLSLRKRKYIVVHLFAGNDGRGLSQEKRRELVMGLSGEIDEEFDLVITGSSADAARAQDAALDTRARVIAGETDMREFINLVHNSVAAVSVDTGAAHIAAHLRKPLVVLSRCEALDAWWSKAQYPKNTNVLCHKEACAEGHWPGLFPRCLNEIDLGAAIDILRKLI